MFAGFGQNELPIALSGLLGCRWRWYLFNCIRLQYLAVWWIKRGGRKMCLSGFGLQWLMWAVPYAHAQPVPWHLLMYPFIDRISIFLLLSPSHVFLSRSFCVWCESHARREQGPNHVQVTKCLHAGFHTKSNDTSWKYKATWAALQIVRWLLSECPIRSAAQNNWRWGERKQKMQHRGCHMWSSYWSMLRLFNVIRFAFF